MDLEFRYGWPYPRAGWFALPVVVTTMVAICVAAGLFRLRDIAHSESLDPTYRSPQKLLFEAAVPSLCVGEVVLLAMWGVATARLPATVRNGAVRLSDTGLALRDRMGREVAILWDAVEELRATPIGALTLGRPRLRRRETRLAGTWLVLRADGQRVRLGWTIEGSDVLVGEIRARARLTQARSCLGAAGMLSLVYRRDHAETGPPSHGPHAVP